MQRQRNKRNQANNEKENDMMKEIQHLKSDLKQRQAQHIQHEKESSEWDIRLVHLTLFGFIFQSRRTPTVTLFMSFAIMCFNC